MDTIKTQEITTIQKALDYCNQRKLFSAGMLKDTLEYLNIQDQRQLDKKYRAADISTPSKYQDLKPEIRDITEYIKALKEDKGRWKN